jgi:hypothetical protein
VIGQKCAIWATTTEDAASLVVDVLGVIEVTQDVLNHFSAVVDN